jgi:uncharacterized membrane protein
MQRHLPYFLLFGFTALWCLGIYIVPLMKNESASLFIYAVYHPVCHQLAEHSFHIGGSALGVCARCTALYTAFLFGIITCPFLGNYQIPFIANRSYILILAVPMVVDVFASWTTGYSSTILSRVVSGGLFGFGAALLLGPMFIEALRQLTKSTSLNSLFRKYGGSV